MQFMKILTSDQETRWINLAQVVRVTLATEAGSGKPVLVLFFVSGDAESRLTIVGNKEKDRKAIEALTARLEELTA